MSATTAIKPEDNNQSVWPLEALSSPFTNSSCLFWSFPAGVITLTIWITFVIFLCMIGIQIVSGEYTAIPVTLFSGILSVLSSCYVLAYLKRGCRCAKQTQQASLK